MKRIIIIGATSGIGHEVAKHYIKEGYQVGVAGRRLERLEALQAIAPTQVHIQPIDVTTEAAPAQLSALIGKELRRFFSCSAYVLNCGIGNILLIIAAVALLIKGGSLFSAFAVEGEAADTGVFLSIVATVMPVIPLFCTSMNAVSAPSISLEGKSIWILQSMPVKGSDVLKAKALTHVIINLPGVIIFSVCAGIALKLGVANTAGMLVLNVAATFFYAFFGIALNLKYHSFDWVNENYPIKQGTSVTITVLSGMGISILYFIPSIILGIAGVPSYAINLIWTLPFALAAWLICRWVLKKGGRKFETLS